MYQLTTYSMKDDASYSVNHFPFIRTHNYAEIVFWPSIFLSYNCENCEVSFIALKW